MQAPIIAISKVDKKYQLSGFLSLLKPLVRKIRPASKQKQGDFYALREIDLEVNRGECLGIIGANGAGKSTLLKILCGISQPTSGEVKVKGRIAPLIEVGVGFSPDLTGRQNIFLNGVILGMSRAEVKRKLDSIVEFSELESFIDVPVKKYSSGMMVRLGFSVAIHTDPEILMVDEVLSVGDFSFQAKCMEKMRKIRRDRQTTLLIVSHALTQISCLADRVLWLDQGRIQQLGKPSDVIVSYVKSQSEKMLPSNPVANPGAPVELLGCEFEGEDGGPTGSFKFRERFSVKIRYRAHRRAQRPYFSVYVKGIFGVTFLASMILDGKRPESIEGDGYVLCHFHSLDLLPGTYQVTCQVNSEDNLEVLSRDECLLGSFVVESSMEDYGFYGPLAGHVSRYSIPNYVDYHWEF